MAKFQQNLQPKAYDMIRFVIFKCYAGKAVGKV